MPGDFSPYCTLKVNTTLQVGWRKTNVWPGSSPSVTIPSPQPPQLNKSSFPIHFYTSFKKEYMIFKGMYNISKIHNIYCQLKITCGWGHPQQSLSHNQSCHRQMKVYFKFGLGKVLGTIHKRRLSKGGGRGYHQEEMGGGRRILSRGDGGRDPFWNKGDIFF